MRNPISQQGRELGLRFFKVHSAVYVVINIMLIAINIQQASREWWFFFPLLAWAVAWGEHYLAAVRWPGRKDLSVIDRLFEANLVAYAPIVVMLATANVLYTPERFWALYPILAWGVILLIQRIGFGGSIGSNENRDSKQPPKAS